MEVLGLSEAYEYMQEAFTQGAQAGAIAGMLLGIIAGYIIGKRSEV